MKQKKIIGIIGGMGPYASAFFYKLIIKKSTNIYHAKNNEDYPEILIDSVPVPDFISDTNNLRVAKKLLISRVTALNNFGCNIIAMVCNTGHLLYQDLASISHSPFISLIDIVCQKAVDSQMKKVGLLATKTTINTRLYQNILEKQGIRVVIPDEDYINMQEEIIRYVIANGDTTKFESILTSMTEKFINKNQLDGVILGCTELPLVFPIYKFNNILDSLDILADRLLEYYYI